MLPDYHLHTSFSGDSNTPPEDQIKRAIELGMPELCTTDHHDYDVVSNTDFTLDTESYMQEMKLLQDKYQSRIPIKIGVELGLQDHLTDYLDAYSKQYPFDFIIGSIHFVNRQDVYYPAFFEDRSLHDAYEEYLKTTLKNIKLHRCFDVLGHLDYVTRYRKPMGSGDFYRDFGDLIDDILRCLIQTGRGIECNTGGMLKNQGQTNPGFDVLRRYHELGGEILTIGSDGHTPETMGWNFNQVRDRLWSCGFRFYTVFNQRETDFLLL